MNANLLYLLLLLLLLHFLNAFCFCSPAPRPPSSSSSSARQLSALLLDRTGNSSVPPGRIAAVFDLPPCAMEWAAPLQPYVPTGAAQKRLSSYYHDYDTFSDPQFDPAVEPPGAGAVPLRWGEAELLDATVPHSLCHIRMSTWFARKWNPFWRECAVEIHGAAAGNYASLLLEYRCGGGKWARNPRGCFQFHKVCGLR